MPLTDAQIVRYSRHILLGAVGGKGQERLLSSGASLKGQGCALATAASYLAAGGTSVVSDSEPLSGDEVGFLFGEQDVGQARDERLTALLRDFNPDALAARARGCLAQAPAEVRGPAPWVLIGQAGRAGLLYRSEQGCSDCFAENARSWGALEEGARQVVLGALAALVFQNSSLERAPKLGGLWVDEDGTVAPIELRACRRCG